MVWVSGLFFFLFPFLFFFFFFLKTCLSFLIIPYYSLFILVLPAPYVGVGSALTISGAVPTPAFSFHISLFPGITLQCT